MNAQVFQIAPAASKAMWAFFIVLGVVMAVLAGMLAMTALGSRNARFEVTGEGLRLHGDLYGRLIPAASLQAAAVRRVDLVTDRSLQPAYRMMGTGLPGYQAGWFHLHNGERALLYLTDRQRAVYLPTTEGFSILLSPSDPDAFVTAIHGLGRPTQ